MCSSTIQHTSHAERIREILQQPLNWDHVFQVAWRNGLMPLLSWNLLKKYSDALPANIREFLSVFLLKHTHKNLFLTQKLIEIVNMLTRNGIPVLPFKGTALAQQAYGNLSLRDYLDLDVLVQPKHFDRAVTILAELGYIPGEKSSWVKRKSRFFTRDKDIRLLSSDGNVCIELHWKLSGAHFALPVEMDLLWNRMETIELGGVKLNGLSFMDLFVYLCLHGSRHGWEKFSWLCDLHELILATEKSGIKIDWVSVQNHASSHGCEKVLDLGLFLVHDFFGLQTNQAHVDGSKNDIEFSSIARDLRSKVFMESGRHNEIGDWYMYHLALKERWSDRMRVHLFYLIWYFKIMFTPNELDQEAFRLPASFYPLYYLLRPIRLIRTRVFLRKKTH